ncbi:hypothetical protein [Paraburkholderia youngii]|uniref:hypothetical protein n=1 Tax=Paraburkholderia youngii TaxID=2782701 RepID=UPI003D1F02E3
MAIDFKAGANRNCKLYTRHEYRGNTRSDEARAGRQIILSARSWELTRDARQLAQLTGFMRSVRVRGYASGPAPEQLIRALQSAVESGDVIAVVSKRQASGANGAPGEQEIRPYYATVTPSQLFRRAVPVESVGRSLQRPKLPRLAADDGLAIWFARPGDMLPDGTIATPVSTPLGDAQAFDYQPDMPAGVSFEIAKTPNNGEPGTWYTNAGSGQMRLYGDDGKAGVDFDFDHDHGQGIPHAHNWDRGVRGPGLPFSLLP